MQMWRITKKTVEHAAIVARLDLTDREIKKLEGELNGILKAFATLDKAPVKNIGPALHPMPIKNVLRDDVPEKCFTQEEALGNTIHKERGFFKGPKAV